MSRPGCEHGSFVSVTCRFPPNEMSHFKSSRDPRFIFPPLTGTSAANTTSSAALLQPVRPSRCVANVNLGSDSRPRRITNTQRLGKPCRFALFD